MEVWAWILGDLNPADRCTKSRSVAKVAIVSLWRDGPNSYVRKRSPGLFYIPTKRNVWRKIYNSGVLQTSVFGKGFYMRKWAIVIEDTNSGAVCFDVVLDRCSDKGR